MTHDRFVLLNGGFEFILVVVFAQVYLALARARYRITLLVKLHSEVETHAL
jgi:hypothetical protein